MATSPCACSRGIGASLMGAGSSILSMATGWWANNRCSRPGAAHDYVSGCPLGTPHGSMEGHYTMERADGSLFDVAIPYFPLAAPADGQLILPPHR